MLGLAQFASLVDTPDVHRGMMHSFKRLVEGTLFVEDRPVADRDRRVRRKARTVDR
jgi:hypothetical protein